MINLDDHIPKRKSISKVVLKSQELKMLTPEGIILESIPLSNTPGELEIGPEIYGETKADEMIKRVREADTEQ